MRPPVTSDPLTILLEHNAWATHQVLGLCGMLSPDQFHRRFEIGFGSLHDTLRHVIHNMRAWADDAAGRPERTSLSAVQDRYTLAEFARLLDDATADLRDQIESTRDRLEECVGVTFEAGGQQFGFTRGVVFTHVLVHGTHHRAQCLNMLRQLGVTDLLDLDINEWQYQTECKP